MLPGSSPSPQSFHWTPATPREETVCVAREKVRSEDVVQPAPVLPQLHPVRVRFSWGLNLSHLSFQRTSPVYLWKTFSKVQGS